MLLPASLILLTPLDKQITSLQKLSLSSFFEVKLRHHTLVLSPAKTLWGVHPVIIYELLSLVRFSTFFNWSALVFITCFLCTQSQKQRLQDFLISPRSSTLRIYIFLWTSSLWSIWIGTPLHFVLVCFNVALAHIILWAGFDLNTRWRKEK